MKRSQKISALIFWLLTASLFSTGCQTLVIQHFQARTNRSAIAEDFFRKLDESVKLTRVQEASVYRISGFPYLRTDRFLLSLKDRLGSDDAFTFWVAGLRQLDQKARTHEIHNLPPSALKALKNQLNLPADPQLLIQKTFQYAQALQEADARQTQFKEILRSATKAPDEYSEVARWLGFYPVFSLVVKKATLKAYRQVRAIHASPVSQLPVYGKLETFGPTPFIAFPLAQVVGWFSDANRNPLDIPQLSEEQMKTLIYSLAPTIVQDAQTDYDRIGKVIWQDGRIQIDTAQPTIYYYTTYTFIRGRPSLQLNYSFWYKGRYGPHAPWMERGPLDGLTVRVTLDQDGIPIFLDVVNNCGCYHFFAPKTQRVIPRPAKATVGPLVATELPENFPNDSLQLRIGAGWHQVQHLDAAALPPKSQTYNLVPYEELEELPHSDGRRESVFNSKGIMKGSNRIEPLFFFSMGIAKVGSMRQRGHHPLKLVGKDYFTNPFLFDQNFIYKK